MPPCLVLQLISKNNRIDEHIKEIGMWIQTFLSEQLLVISNIFADLASHLEIFSHY